MDSFSPTSQPEASRAFNIILERLYAMARQAGSSLGAPSDLEATLTALPSANRGQVMLVLESVESRAQARADAELAEAARAVRVAAKRVWTQDEELVPQPISHGVVATELAGIQSHA